MSRRAIATALFVGLSAIYLHSSSGYVPPYRDAGEMVVMLETLGVPHAPGYPLYALAGQVTRFLPFGHAAYQASLFSALCAAGAVTLLFLLLSFYVATPLAVVSSLLLAFSNPFWELAVVPEMYSFGALALVGVLYSAFKKEDPLLTALLMGLALGVRMDLLLTYPVIVAAVAWKRRIPWAQSALMFFVGTSIFLYLPVRSLQQPWLDWSNPENLSSLLSVMTRKSYSGTLDLLSLSYARGANLLPSLGFWIKHIGLSFAFAGGILSLAGIAAFSKQRIVMTLAGIVFVAGPVFLFLANMPPNPHALAVLEAAFLPADIALAALAAFGLKFFAEKGFRPVFCSLILIVLMTVQAPASYLRADKRWNLMTRDYVENTWRSIPQASISVFQEDVQLFTLWTSQLVDGRRPDVSLVSVGLSGSPWYWDMVGRWPVRQAPRCEVKNPAGWQCLASRSDGRPLTTGPETTLPEIPGLINSVSGMVYRFSNEPRTDFFVDGLFVHRSAARYGETPDFFSSDLLADVARMHHEPGLRLLTQEKFSLADRYIRKAESLDPTSARFPADRAYIAFREQRFEDAKRLYETAVILGTRALGLTSVYRSLPDVVKAYASDLSNFHVSLGGVQEKLGQKQSAEGHYYNALDLWPNAQAHFNLAVIYWGQDWNKVVDHLEQTLRIRPDFPGAAKYLEAAKSRRN